MRKLIRATLVAGGASSLLLCSLVHAEQESAGASPPEQSASPPEPSTTAPSTGRVTGIEEIVVTARRVEENLQDVPTAVTAINEKDLKDLQINGFQNVGQTAPNVYIQKQAGSPAAPQFNIRGVSTGNLNLQNDNGIGLYVDGVYLGRPAASGFDIADLQRVEVLRGPQGTLFGRNATGGAINIITAAPTGEFGLHGELGVGNFLGLRQNASVNLPAWRDLAVKFTVAHSEHDGYVKNSYPQTTYHFSSPYSGDLGSYTTSKEYGDADTDALLFAARYTGLDKLTVDYKFDYTSWTGTMDGRQNLSLDPTFEFISNYSNQPQYGGTNSTSLNRLGAFPSNFDSPSSLDVQGNSLSAAYEINDDLSVKYIGGYRAYYQEVGLNNLDGNAFVDTPPNPGNPFMTGSLKPWVLLGALRNEWQHQLSHELQLTGTEGPVDWITGLFYFNEKGGLDNPVFFAKTLTPSGSTPNANNALTIGDYFSGQAAKVDNQSEAGFAHITYHLIEQWDLSGGVRYTKDDRKEKVFANAAVALGTISPGQTFKYTGNKVDYDASATYKITSSMNVYAKTATGFVSGGVLGGQRFSPETMKAYEVGYKSDLLNNRLRFNSALFYQDREDLQVLGFTQSNGVFIFNGGREKSTGLELETTYIPLDGLSLNGSYGYTHVKNENGVRTFQPKHTTSLGAQYDFLPLANGSAPSFRVDASYHSDAFRLPCQAGVSEDPVQACNVKPSDTPNPQLDKQLILKGNVQLGSRLSLNEIPLGSKASGRISLWGRNLLNTHEYEFLFPVIGQQALGTFQTPRTYGLDFGVNF